MRASIVAGLAIFLAIQGCTKKENSKSESRSSAAETNGEPSHILVQHILIGFEGSLPGKKITRTSEQAKKLAVEIYEKSKKEGADFDALVKEYTDDRAPGVYGMSNFGVSPEGEEYPRDQMVPAFGNVGFKLQKGEVGLADYDKAVSPYGYHIIKRVN